MTSNLKQFFSVSLVLFFFFSAHSQEFNRKKYNFNSDWKLKFGDFAQAKEATFNDKNWEQITLPYAFNQKEAFKKDITQLTTGIVWYRKLSLPDEYLQIR